ncbi:DUF3455 domain-containing protein [Actinoplanes sp. NPDC051851]|uniref:DUF3455 domain-containing protein n=1 Tax=Actinoplanes sp. NPDC051851 TaxID=3154753 RepID=UPI00342AB271
MTPRTKIASAFGGLAAVALGVPAGVSFAGTGERAPTETRPATTQDDSFLGGGLTVPATLEPPPGNAVHAVLKARGVQIYTCTSGAWQLTEPAASLNGITLSPVRKVTALHFRGPSWESDQDGSLVEGARPVSAPSTTPNSIPQLLITAARTRGDGLFGGVTYIQRLATSGGVAPATTCTTGDTLAVPYRAVYRFFRKKS